AGRAGHGLIILRHDDAATRLKTLDALAAARPRLRGFERAALLRGLIARTAIVKHDKRFRFHHGVTLHDFHIAGEHRLLVLVAHFEAGGIDLDRLVAILGKALQ